jgi:hypothetical protein
MKALPLLLALLLSVPLAAQTSFSLRNTDAEAVFYFWALPGTPKGPSALAGLPLAPGGRHAVAPGERVAVNLPENHSLLGAFLPWKEALSLLTPLAGGLILASEAPVKGTLLVDRKGFLALNRGRGWEAPLQEWGLPVPVMVLDGRSADWSGIPNLLEWGPLFRPPSGSWPAGWPRPRTLQAVFRDGALWVRLTLATSSPAGEASLLFRRSGGTLEWPLAGGTVWAWNDSSPPRAVGTAVLSSGVLEAWIPWDRVGAAEASAWTKSEGTWLYAAAGAAPRSVELGASAWEDLP